MDVLSSLQLDTLPEQQTRVVHLAKALADNADLRLGFEACCYCAATLNTKNTVSCRGCQRVSYCSVECRKEDAKPTAQDDSENAFGHSSLICTLLRTCNEDEDAEDPTATRSTAAARDRVESEKQSYPATMANILAEGPCYEEMRRSTNGTLCIHVVGASVDAELWGKDSFDDAFCAYSEACLSLVESTNTIKQIDVHFFGPECPVKAFSNTKAIKPDSDQSGKSLTFTFSLFTHKRLYNREATMSTKSNPHFVVFFNPGFTCPDYEWESALTSIPVGTGFLLSTNTEMEGVNDAVFLRDKGYLSKLPSLVAEITGEDYHDEEEEEDMSTFFAENPYVGSRIRQNGTLANDLFVRNRWMMGGVWSRAEIGKSKPSTHKRRESRNKETTTSKKKARTNNKRSNPALI